MRDCVQKRNEHSVKQIYQGDTFIDRLTCFAFLCPSEEIAADAPWLWIEYQDWINIIGQLILNR